MTQGAFALATQGFALTGLLYYFGWARENARLAHFGIDVSATGLTTADFILRGVSSSLIILLAVSAGMLGMLFAVRYLLQGGRDARIESAVRVSALPVAVLLTIASLLLPSLAARPSSVANLGRPLLLLGACAAAAARLMVIRADYGMLRARVRGEQVALTALTALALLWAATSYAAWSGSRSAAAFDVHSATPVVLYSSQDLDLHGPGIIVSTLPGAASAFHYRYEGLHLLLASGGHLFLLPSLWRPGQGDAIELPDGDSGLRVEFGAEVGR